MSNCQINSLVHCLSCDLFILSHGSISSLIVYISVKFACITFLTTLGSYVIYVVYKVSHLV